MTPLVSIIVITYNSSDFVIETLDSIRAQTYENIELIISDDASTDNTIEICCKWVEKNKSRFVRTKILTVPSNTGIPANYNRGILDANGNWIKPIAGDDALLPNCIQDNVDYILNQHDIKVLYSYNRVYKYFLLEENFLGLNPSSYPLNIISDNISALEQYKILLSGDRVSFTPSLFLNREAILDAGLPDEDLFSEHHQTLLKLTKCGYKLNFMDKQTVQYRKHENATNNTVREYILKPHYFKTENFRRRYIYPHIPKDLRLSHKFVWIVNQLFRFELLNKRNKINIFIHYLLNVVLNPFKYIIYIKSKYVTKYRYDVFYN